MMSATGPTVERRLTAFMDDPDPADSTNVMHSSDGAQEYGYTAAVGDWGDGVWLGGSGDPAGLGGWVVGRGVDRCVVPTADLFGG